VAVPRSGVQRLWQSGADVLMGNDLHKPGRSPGWRGQRLLLTGLLGLLAACPTFAPLHASESQPGDVETRVNETEAKIKVAYVYNFLKFIEWPRDGKNAATAPFRICLIGTDPIRTMLGELSVRKVKERPIEVAHVRNLNALSDCHLLYVSRSEESDLPRILEKIRGAPVLSVSDILQFGLKGGMIGFFTEADRVKIEINQKSVLLARLKVSAKLLEIARIVP
jgi:hypothetical protein